MSQNLRCVVEYIAVLVLVTFLLFDRLNHVDAARTRGRNRFDPPPPGTPPPDPNYYTWQHKGAFDGCDACAWTLDTIQQGKIILLPRVCNKLYTFQPHAYAWCQETLEALHFEGDKVRYWITRGCFGFAANLMKAWVVPCPSYAICTHLKHLQGDPFCVPPASLDANSTRDGAVIVQP